MTEENLRMYILVNGDIKISKGKLPGQVGHAVSSFIYHVYMKEKDFNGLYDKEVSMDEYMKRQKKIILKCDQETLERLERTGYVTIRDMGLTELEENTLTCVNFGIHNLDNVPDWIKELKLYH